MSIPDKHVCNADIQKAICAGKRSIADYLVAYQGFSLLYLEPAPQSLTVAGWEAQDGQTDRIQRDTESNAERRSFATGEALLDFVTKRWQSRWVTLDIHEHEVLEKFSLRPWFLLVSVDAPVLVRWERFKEWQVNHIFQFLCTTNP